MNFIFDIKYALRMLLNKPQFTALSTLIMAVGLGLTIYMTAFLSNMLYKDLDIENGEQVYMIVGVNNGERQRQESISFPDYQEIKQASRSYLHLGALQEKTTALSNGDNSRRYNGTYVTTNIFDVFKSPINLGRSFSDDDFMTGAAPVTVISHNLWKDYFQQNKKIVGKTVQINGLVTEIIGVMSPGREYPSSSDLWIPATDNLLKIKRSSNRLAALYVHKKPDITVEQANAELAGIMKRLAQQYPDTNTDHTARLITVPKSQMGNEFSVINTLLITAVLLILILACLNVSNLLLSRANERAKETAIRLALGAPRSRLIVQMMWESILICSTGGIIGILAAAYGLEILNHILSVGVNGAIPFWWHSEVDGLLISQAVTLIALTAFITGIVPAWKMTQCNVNTELRDGTRGAVGKKSGYVSRLLVIIEISLSSILLIITCVLYILLEDSKDMDYGADINNRLQARTVLSESSFKDDSTRIQYFKRLMAELKQIPGVESVGSMSTIPGNFTRFKEFIPDGHEIINHKYPKANRVISLEQSMQTLGIKLLEGRHFDHRDTQDSLKVAIITDSLAKEYWPNESALGKRIKFRHGGGKQWLSIVGVVQHVAFDNGIGPRKHQGSVFQPYTQQTYRHMSNFITVNETSENKLDQITAAVARVDPMVPTYQVHFIKDNIEREKAGMTFILETFSLFAIATLFLAATGIYGVIANTTSRRTQELGIRRALGATDQNVMILLMKQGWIQLAIGLLVGLPIGYLASLGFVNMLVPSSNNYYYAYIFVPVIIAVIVVFSTYLPARKAIKLEPNSALRYE